MFFLSNEPLPQCSFITLDIKETERERKRERGGGGRENTKIKGTRRRDMERWRQKMRGVDRKRKGVKRE